MEFEYLLDGTPRRIAVEKKEAVLSVREGGTVIEVEARPLSDHEVLLMAGGRPHRAVIVRDRGRLHVLIDGREFVLAPAGERDGRPGAGAGGGSGDGRRVVAPMPGKVIKVCVAEGERVRRNQTLVIVEAMKMENEIKAPADGVVAKIRTKPGELVDSELTLVELEPAGPVKEA
jgi:biotin carboxyl carrier protein